MYVDGRNTYYDLNKYILQAGANTILSKNKKKKGWFHFICDSLILLIYTRDKLLYDYWTLVIVK